jgi:hypothetical protein
MKCLHYQQQRESPGVCQPHAGGVSALAEVKKLLGTNSLGLLCCVRLCHGQYAMAVAGAISALRFGRDDQLASEVKHLLATNTLSLLCCVCLCDRQFSVLRVGLENCVPHTRVRRCAWCVLFQVVCQR